MTEPSGMPERTGGRGKRVAAVTAGVVTAGVVLTGGVFAARWYLGGGPQPAEALPGSTIGYVALDLDPGGKDLLAARDALAGFPAWEELDIDSGGDVRRQLFDLAQRGLQCDSLDFEEDVDSWLGNRVAVAAVPADDEEGRPLPVVVAQVADADAADDGLTALGDCPGFGPLGWHIEGEWAVLAESDDVADRVAEEAADEPLSDDPGFEEHVEAAGGTGILTAYASADAGRHIADAIEQELVLDGVAAPPAMTDDLLDSFGGMALSVGFEDDALQVDAATSTRFAGPVGGIEDAAAVGDLVGALPSDTAALLGLGFADGWAGDYVQSLRDVLGPEADLLDTELDGFEAETGLDLVETLEAVLGEAAVLAVGGDLTGQLLQLPDPAALSVGLKVQGDADEVEEALDDVYAAVPPYVADLGDAESEGDVVVLGPSDDYREALLDGGDLGSSERFERAVPGAADATAVFYVDLDAPIAEELLALLPPEVAANVQPLDAVGASSRLEDGMVRSSLRLTLD